MGRCKTPPWVAGRSPEITELQLSYSHGVLIIPSVPTVPGPSRDGPQSLSFWETFLVGYFGSNFLGGSIRPLFGTTSRSQLLRTVPGPSQTVPGPSEH